MHSILYIHTTHTYTVFIHIYKLIYAEIIKALITLQEATFILQQSSLILHEAWIILQSSKQHYFISCLLLFSPRTAKNHQEQPRTAKNCQEHAKNQLINDCTHAPFSDTPDPTYQPSHRSQGSKIRGRRCPGLWPASIESAAPFPPGRGARRAR